MSQYETMTIAELEAENRRLMAEKDKIREQQRALNAALTRKVAEAEADRIVAGLTNDQKAAVAQRVHPTGIASAEKVGTPGNPS